MGQCLAKILIIEDEPSVAQVISRFLQRAGFVPLVAAHGEEGLELACRERPALIFCDERMPGLSGGDTLGRLKENLLTAQIPVIMMGGSNVEGLCDWIRYGAAAFLPKPFNAPQLLGLVRDILREDQTPAR